MFFKKDKKCVNTTPMFDPFHQLRHDFNQILKRIEVDIKEVKDLATGAQSKADKLINELSNYATDSDIDNLKKVAIAHAERIDAMARFLKIDYIDKVETKVTKEYQKIK